MYSPYARSWFGVRGSGAQEARKFSDQDGRESDAKNSAGRRRHAGTIEGDIGGLGIAATIIDDDRASNIH
jgi:hypothetical protein